ncbi:MAG: YbhB/YbcL family Raf kinase inhibitor-like protein [Proteobacteria bacterium]|nr:YbhB/YbcL family Raf kinase inhibitor-like protein [Pseudomonadota bacterium]
MQLTSPAFGHNQEIPSRFSCDGDNVNPPLEISGAPPGTASLVLILEDPDVPRNLKEDGMWDHWVLFNMPPDLAHIYENEEPPGRHGTGTAGNTGYFGPCPPDRRHRYFFKLFALDVRLGLPERVSKAEVESAMSGHVLASAELVGLYERKKG